MRQDVSVGKRDCKMKEIGILYLINHLTYAGELDAKCRAVLQPRHATNFILYR